MLCTRESFGRLIHREPYLATFAVENAGDCAPSGWMSDGRGREPRRGGPFRESVSRRYTSRARRALRRGRIDYPIGTRSESLPDDLGPGGTHRRKHRRLADSVIV